MLIMNKIKLTLLGMSLCFGAAVFAYTWAVARESHAIVTNLEHVSHE